MAEAGYMILDHKLAKCAYQNSKTNLRFNKNRRPTDFSPGFLPCWAELSVAEESDVNVTMLTVPRLPTHQRRQAPSVGWEVPSGIRLRTPRQDNWS